LPRIAPLIFCSFSFEAGGIKNLYSRLEGSAHGRINKGRRREGEREGGNEGE